MNDSEYEVYFDVEHLRFNNLYKKTYKDKNIKLDINDINYNLLLNKYTYQKKEGIIPGLKCNIEDSMLKYINLKQNNIIEYYISHGYNLAKTSVKTISRLIIGHGEVSVREASIKLDHIYGIPFIPASSIRGAFRNYLNEKYSEADSENNAYSENKIVTDICGSEDKIGQLIFLDIYPRKFEVGVDVMTPHYGDYYSKGKCPTDDMKPNPIKFPTVQKGAEFDIVVLCKQKNYVIDERTINIENEFKNFLEEKPLGAKTSVGYGYFEFIKRKED